MVDMIDFAAALPPRQAAEVRTQRRKAKSTRKAAQPKLPSPNILMDDNQLDGIGDDNLLLATNSKDHKQLDAKETLFLMNWLPGKMTKKKAMIKAGYKYDREASLYQKAANIIKRYERAAADKADIFRDVGIGEAQVAQNIKQIADKGRSEIVRLQANALAAKALRLTDAPPPTHQGIQIVVNTIVQAPSDSQGNSRAPGREGTTVIHVQPGEVDESAKPLQITR